MLARLLHSFQHSSCRLVLKIETSLTDDTIYSKQVVRPYFLFFASFATVDRNNMSSIHYRMFNLILRHPTYIQKHKKVHYYILHTSNSMLSYLKKSQCISTTQSGNITKYGSFHLQLARTINYKYVIMHHDILYSSNISALQIFCIVPMKLKTLKN